MGSISLQIPQVGQPDSTEDPKIASDLTAIQAVINGNIDSTNLSPGLLNSFVQAVTTGIKMSIGTGTFTWTGTPNSPTVTVTHNLGRTPTAVLFGQKFTSVSFLSFVSTAQTVGSTTFTAWGNAVNGTPNSGETGVFYWAAIG